MKPLLTELVNRPSDLGASLDALEAELTQNGTMRTGAVGARFAGHKLAAESHLALVRSMIAQLPE